MLARAAQGEEDAFVVLYERHRDVLFRFACRMLGSIDAAEDVVHDCFLSLLRHPQAFDPARASLRTYLCAAARNQALKRTLQGGREAWSDLPDAGGPARALQVLIEDEDARRIRDAVLALPPLQREVVVLVEYEELSLAEVARIVDIEIGAVKSRLHRARVSLRAALMPEAEEGSR